MLKKIKVNDKRKIRIMNFKRFIAYAIIFLILVFSFDVYAGPDNPPITYYDSISEDEEGSSLVFPYFIFSEPVRNEIYVSDSKTRVVIYTSDFFPLYTLDKRNGIEAPQGLTVDSEGNLYVAQSATNDNPKHRISVFNACLKWERDIYFAGFEGYDSFVPYRVALDRNMKIYVAGIYFPGVLVMDNRGNLLTVLAPEEDGKKVKLNFVQIDKAGKIYLVSEEEGHIYVYDETLKFLFRFGEKGGSSGKLSRPQAVSIDNRNGNIYVVDYMRHTVSAYDKEGKYLYEFGGLGWGEGWFQYPKDLSVDAAGKVLVADTFNNRIEVFKPRE